MAAKAHVPVSKFVVEKVKNSLRQEEVEADFKPRADLIRELEEKKEEMSRLAKS
jgi:hypothetical protein